MARCKRELEELRSRLLDMTTRNNLLNYKMVSGRSVKLAETDLSKIYLTLVVNEKGMTFRPAGTDTIADAEEQKYWGLPRFSQKNEELLLDTPYTDIELRKRLYALQVKSRSVFEEQGYPVLYLALGFIEWSDSNNKNLKAPLMMIPVELVRRKLKDDYTLSWSGEDPQISPTLVAKLLEQKIELPELGHLESDTDIIEYFAAVEAIIHKKKWHITYDAILDLFNFKKYVMYKDLDPDSWGDSFSMENQPLLNALFNPKSAKSSVSGVTSGVSSEHACFNIVDADSSQLSVIAEAKNGMNLVVEGPPGTGKSQTIVNMIAEMLARGKTVLFVSEKMAALEVVKHRLDAAGLSPYCLELHSQTAKKVELLRELERCMQFRSEPVKVDEQRPIVLKTLDVNLLGYCDELKSPIGGSGFTPYELYGLHEKYRSFFASRGEHPPGIVIDNVMGITLSEYQEALSALTNLQAFIPALLQPGETLASHPWAGTRPGTVMPSDCEEIRGRAETYQKMLKHFVAVIKDVCEEAHIPIPETEADLPSFIETCRIVLVGFEGTESTLCHSAWGKTVIVDSLISRQESIYRKHQEILEKFTPEIFTCNPSQLYETYMRGSDRGFMGRLFSNEFKDLKATVAPYYRIKVPAKEQILSDLRDVRDYLLEYAEWRDHDDEFKELFSNVWKGVDTPSDTLSAYSNWVHSLVDLEQNRRITKETFRSFAPGQIDTSAYSHALDRAYQGFLTARRDLFNRLGMSEEFRRIPLEDILRQSDQMVARTDRLEEWGKFRTYVINTEKTSAAPVIPFLLSGKLDYDALVPSYIAGYAESLLKEAYKTRKKLSDFSQVSQEKMIEAFRLADKEDIVANAKRIARILDARKPEAYSGNVYDEELSVLTGEFTRKRGHMSIRNLMTRAGSTIQRIKPCFMMSPLSVAQYLDPRSVMFDIIIFDEASQVRPEDALGALMRGKQLVVMGDSRQLPPTTFFDSVGSSDAEDDDEESHFATITDMESLLHVCKQVFPSRRLSWHYRSRHESLIAVSNAEFYDGGLMVFPSPKHETTDLGLFYHYLPDTVYDRGNTGTNRGEAREVAEAVIEYYTRFPEKTLGVATFSTKQQEAIRREVNLLLRTNPAVEAMMHPASGEDFFVKNLETIQGDERDTILISIGYGFDSEHHLSTNFGPLNQIGGERRLNVLITRARERCVVFSNFKGYEIPITPTTPSGLKALSKFLVYAESRNMQSLSSNGAEEGNFEMDNFTDSVASVLRDAGYLISRNVGCAGFKIDIAVSDPQNPGIYMAGILCDSRYYWRTSDTRDRDRLRIQILEGLGWNIMRVWSAEWFQHPDSCRNELLKFLQNPSFKVVVDSKPLPVIEPVSCEESIIEKSSEEKPVSEMPKKPRKRSSKKITEPVVEKSTDNIFEPLEEVGGGMVESKRASKLSQKPSPAVTIPLAGIVPYAQITSSVLQLYHQFSSVPDTELQKAIVEIVVTEGPISESLLMIRIKELGNVSRMTQTIKFNIGRLINESLAEGTISTDPDGFYCAPGIQILPRVRSEKWDIKDVSRYEIAIAAGYLLACQSTLEKSILVKRTAISLGFNPTPLVVQRVSQGVDHGCGLGLLLESNGFVQLMPKE